MKAIQRILPLTLVLIFAAALQLHAQGCMEPTSDEGVSVVGYLQPQFEYNFTDPDHYNTFSFNRARVAFIGSIPYDFSYYFMVDFSKFKPEATYLLDGFISYNRFDWARLTFGQFKSPISLEQNTPCQSLHTIQRSRVVNELAGPDRDIGLMVSGGSNETLFKYSLALMNDYRRGVKDENNAKSLKGRIVLNPIEYLSIGGSFAWGTTGADSDNDKIRFGADLEFRYSNFLLQGEYIYGEDTGDYTTGGGCDGTPLQFHTGGVKRSGYFIQAMYMTNFFLQPVFKFEGYDADTSIDDNSQTIMTYGLNYFFNDWTRLQVNYLYKAEQDNEIANDALMVQLQVKF